MIRVILGRSLDTRLGGLPDCVAICLTYEGDGFLKFLPMHRVREFLGPEQWTGRRAGRDLRVGALCKWAEPVLGQQGARGGKDAPFEKVPFRDRAPRKRFDNLKPIRARLFRLCPIERITLAEALFIRNLGSATGGLGRVDA